MERAVVTNVDRKLGIVRCDLDADNPPGQIISAVYLTPTPPAPRSIVRVLQLAPSQWACLGCENEQRMMLHDDFLSVNNSFFGDTNWFVVGGAVAGAIAQSGAQGIQGGADIVTPAIAGNFWGISKDNQSLQLPNAPAALWLSGVFRPDLNAATPGGGVGSFVGFGNNLSANGWNAAGGNASACGVLCDTTKNLNFYLRTIDGANATHVDTGIPIVLGSHHFDIVVQGSSTVVGGSGMGLWAGIWIDGQGPFSTVSNVPPSSSAKAPQVVATVLPLLAAARGITVDWLHLEYVGSIRTP